MIIFAGITIVAKVGWKNLMGIKTARAQIRDYHNNADKMLCACKEDGFKNIQGIHLTI